MLRSNSGAAAYTAALFVLGVATSGAAWAAASFSASPLKLDLPANRLAAALTLGNKGPRAVTVQAELVSWNQDNGEDTYGRADGLVVTPPITSIAAGAQQVVRAGRLKRGTAPAREQAYRLIVTEVPPDGQVSGGRVATVMQLSFPLFVPPADRQARAQFDLSAEALAGGDLRIRVANGGLVHGKITQLNLLEGGKPLAERTLNYYVLAGARRELAWPGALKSASGGALELRVKVDARKEPIVLPVTTATPAAAAPAPSPEPVEDR